jgi:hypothetical protein
MECWWYIECPKIFVHDSEAELKKSLTAAVKLSDEDEDQDEDVDETAAEDAQKLKKKAPTKEKATSKKKAATKADSNVTEIASKKVTTKGKAESTVTSLTASKYTPGNDTVMTDARSVPLPFTQSRVQQPSPPILSQPTSTEFSPQALTCHQRLHS